MVEQKPSKLTTRVRFPSPAPFTVRKFCPCGSVVEHSLGKGEVGSSILPMGTTHPPTQIATETGVATWQRKSSSGLSRT